MLVSFWETFKSLFIEGINGSTGQIRKSKPVPSVGSHALRVSRVHFSSEAKFGKGGNGSSSLELPQKPGVTERLNMNG